MLSTIKQAFLFFFVGCPVGAMVTSFIAPWFIKVFHVPMSEPSALCNCAELADNIMQSFWRVQLGGTITGGILGVVLWGVLRKKGKLKGKAAAPAPEAKPESKTAASGDAP